MTKHKNISMNQDNPNDVDLTNCENILPYFRKEKNSMFFNKMLALLMCGAIITLASIAVLVRSMPVEHSRLYAVALLFLAVCFWLMDLMFVLEQNKIKAKNIIAMGNLWEKLDYANTELHHTIEALNTVKAEKMQLAGKNTNLAELNNKLKNDISKSQNEISALVRQNDDLFKEYNALKERCREFEAENTRIKADFAIYRERIKPDNRECTESPLPKNNTQHKDAAKMTCKSTTKNTTASKEKKKTSAPAKKTNTKATGKK